jgi:WD40 repeat protein
MLDHVGDIVGVALHPDQKLVATGESDTGAKPPKIIVWDTESMATVSILEGFHKKGIAHLSFNAKGDQLVSIGMDRDNSIAVYDWAQKMIIATGRCGKTPIYCCAFTIVCAADTATDHAGVVPAGSSAAAAAESSGGDAGAKNSSWVSGSPLKAINAKIAGALGGHSGKDATTKGTGTASAPPASIQAIVTCGKKCISFWTLKSGTLTSKKGSFGRRGEVQQMLCCTPFMSFTVTGQEDGSLFMWSGNQLIWASTTKHGGAVLSMQRVPDGASALPSSIAEVEKGGTNWTLQRELLVTGDAVGTAILWCGLGQGGKETIQPLATFNITAVPELQSVFAKFALQVKELAL